MRFCELESAQGEKIRYCLCVALHKPRCGATVCVQRKPLMVHFDVRKSASKVLLYMKDLQMWAYCPHSRHVHYFIIHCQWLKINVDFRGESVQWSQTPSPLAYAVYAFINVDNCERPLTCMSFSQDFPIIGVRQNSIWFLCSTLPFCWLWMGQVAWRGGILLSL